MHYDAFPAPKHPNVTHLRTIALTHLWADGRREDLHFCSTWAHGCVPSNDLTSSRA